MDVFSGTQNPDPDCGDILSYWSFDDITITFTGANPELNKMFYVLNYPYFISNPYYLPTPERSGDNLGIEIGSSLSTFISWPTLAVYANDSTRYTDTATINGLLYKGVNLCDSSKVLYNYHYGILRFIDANQRTWTKKF